MVECSQYVLCVMSMLSALYSASTEFVKPSI